MKKMERALQISNEIRPKRTTRLQRRTRSNQYGIISEEHQQNRSRNATAYDLTSPLKQSTLLQQIPTCTSSLPSFRYPTPDPQHKQPLLTKLYNNIIKHKQLHSKVVTTQKQKERYLHRFAKTIKDQQFKATGFDLNYQCLKFVFDYIKINNHINCIILDGNSMGFEGIQQLAELVRTCDIQHLSLVSVGMNNKGASVLFQAIKVKSTVKKLDISSNQSLLKNRITAQGVSHLKDVLGGDSLVDVLKMDQINLGNQGLKAGFQGIDNPPLEQLYLCTNQLTFKNMPQFMNNINTFSLLKLDLSKNHISNDGLKALTDCLGTNYGRSRLSINIKYLNISDNKITSLGFQHFCREMACNKTLQNLNISNNPLGQGQRFYNIKYFLLKNFKLKILNLTNTGIIYKDTKMLCEGLQGNKYLQELNLASNEICSDSIYDLFNMLTQNKCLKMLSLQNCKICDNLIVNNQAALLSSFPTIQLIDLDNNYIGNKGAQILSTVIPKNKNILSLSLNKNCIGQRPLLMIQQLLKDNLRKKCFYKELDRYQNQLQMYQGKSVALKKEVDKMGKYEEQLKIGLLVDEIVEKSREEEELSSLILAQRKNISKISKYGKEKANKKKKKIATPGNTFTIHVTEPQ